MMAEESGARGRKRRRIGWWVAATVGLVPVALGALLLVYWVHDHVPERVYWRMGLGFLIVLEVGYGVALLAAVVASPVLAVVLYRARRRGVSRLGVARGLLLGVTVLFGLALAEAGAAVWQARVHRAMVVPIGGRADEDPHATRLVDPEEIALPTTFADATHDGVVNLVIIGESSAEGVPYNFWVSLGRMLLWQLEQAIPARRFDVQVLATSRETLERQHRKLADLSKRPDALIVYCGHNEFASRFPWTREVAHYADARPPASWERFVARVERTSPLCGLIHEAAEKCRIAIPPSPEELRALVDVPAYTPSEYAALLADFRRRLERIVTYAEAVGALPILIVPPANDMGFEPNRSFLPARTPYAERAAFAREFREARGLEGSSPARSIERYRALVARQPGFAEAHYRLGVLLERAGVDDEAYRRFIAARDHDGLPFRCPTAFQDVYRDVAARHSCLLIDSQAYFHAIGRRGMLDDSLFHDGMHPSLRGQIALAQAVLQGLRARRAFGWPETTPAPMIDPTRCAAHFGLIPAVWERLCLWGIMFYDMTAPLRYDPSVRRAKQDAFGKAYDRIVAGRAPEAVGLPNIGVPAAVPLVRGAVVSTGPSAVAPEPRGEARTQTPR